MSNCLRFNTSILLSFELNWGIKNLVSNLTLRLIKMKGYVHVLAFG